MIMITIRYEVVSLVLVPLKSLVHLLSIEFLVVFSHQFLARALHYCWLKISLRFMIPGSVHFKLMHLIVIGAISGCNASS